MALNLSKPLIEFSDKQNKIKNWLLSSEENCTLLTMLSNWKLNRTLLNSHSHPIPNYAWSTHSCRQWVFKSNALQNNTLSLDISAWDMCINLRRTMCMLMQIKPNAVFWNLPIESQNFSKLDEHFVIVIKLQKISYAVWINKEQEIEHRQIAFKFEM